LEQRHFSGNGASPGSIAGARELRYDRPKWPINRNDVARGAFARARLAEHVRLMKPLQRALAVVFSAATAAATASAQAPADTSARNFTLVEDFSRRADRPIVRTLNYRSNKHVTVLLAQQLGAGIDSIKPASV
jgi:hypothetical protein